MGASSESESDSQHVLALRRLMDTLARRAHERPPGSYTTKLLDGGLEKIAGKIREEAEELIEAGGEADTAEGRAHFVYEAADLLFHTMVLLAWRGVDIDDVAKELERREGTSGLVEKANRAKKESTE
ncbi:phosphoribosyl-ATP diphosphatase [Roseimaritima sediminicola]|uniref:phosphoribosyl-ATP diphosphatase n=1 Tax=Roseimaritima sediminicola TaxID=2662066 RepID=UPI0012982A7B|nr:phosphoribosyl-ATP diphosphatase [Roseimaritima sediminicola]